MKTRKRTPSPTPWVAGLLAGALLLALVAGGMDYGPITWQPVVASIILAWCGLCIRRIKKLQAATIRRQLRAAATTSTNTTADRPAA